MARETAVPEADVELLSEALDAILDIIEKVQANPSAKLRLAACKAVQDETFAIITHLSVGMIVPAPMWTKEPVKALIEAVLFLAECTEKSLLVEPDWDLACEAVSDSAIRLRDALTKAR